MTEPTSWRPREPRWNWRAYLTTEERTIVVAAEIKASEARKALAEASALRGPIQNRAIQRAKYDAQQRGRS